MPWHESNVVLRSRYFGERSRSIISVPRPLTWTAVDLCWSGMRIHAHDFILNANWALSIGNFLRCWLNKDLSKKKNNHKVVYWRQMVVEILHSFTTHLMWWYCSLLCSRHKRNVDHSRDLNKGVIRCNLTSTVHIAKCMTTLNTVRYYVLSYKMWNVNPCH